MSKLDDEIRSEQKKQKSLLKEAKAQKQHHAYLQKLSTFYVIFCSISPAKQHTIDFDKKLLKDGEYTKWDTFSYKGYCYSYYMNVPQFLAEHKGTYVPSDPMFPDQSGEVRFDDVSPHFASRILGNINTAMEVTRPDDFLFTKSEALDYIKKSKYPNIMKHEIIPAKYAHPNNLFFRDEI